MMYKCKVHCQNTNIQELEDLGIEDRGKWLPFCFDLDLVAAYKMTTDIEEDSCFACTTVFWETGETFILDTKYDAFEALFAEYRGEPTIDDTESGDPEF